MIEDTKITIAQLIFIISFVPTIWESYKTKQSTISLWHSVPTMFALFYLMGASFYSLGLWWSFIAVVSAGALWGVAAVQRYIYEEKK